MKTNHLKTATFIGAWFGYLAPWAALAQPIITTQPTNHFANTASSFNFYVGASGTAPLSYQWLFNGASIAGATLSSLPVFSPQPSQWGYYSVIVSNASGSVTSQVAELEIFSAAPHSLSGIQAQPDGSMNLSFAGEMTAALGPYYDLYPLECSSNLVDWAPLAMLQRSNAALDTLRFSDTNAPNFSQRFYRTPTNQLATPDPAPTGPYAVGTFSMVMIDPSRTNAVGETNYQFMTTFWYPTVPQAGLLPAKYVEPQVALGQSYYNVTAYGGGNFSSQVAGFFSHSLSNAPLATNLTKYPVLVYGPIGRGHRRDNTDKAEDLASWGYVVVGVDAIDTYVSVFPSGTVLTGQVLNVTSMASLSSELEARVRDQQFVLDQLEALDAGDPRLGGRLDLDKIGAFGTGFGASAAAQLCLRDPRCKAGVAFDVVWFIETNVLTQALGIPFLFLDTDRGPNPDPVWQYPDGRPDDRLDVFAEQVTNACWAKVASTIHGSLCDIPLIVDSASFAAGWGGVPMSGQFLPPARASQLVRGYLLSFFNKFLKDQDDHLLDGPSAAYPEVMQFLSTSSASGAPKYPCAGVVQGSDGSLYGTTAYGGAGGNGAVFQVTTGGVLTVLVSFNGTNGSHPGGTLLRGSDGNFYGTTAYGGTNGNNGTVFQVTPAGVLTTLVSFSGCDGKHPVAGLAQGNDGDLYGTTILGGAQGLGTAFKITTGGLLTLLVSFNGTNGSAPFAALVQGSDGNFYGSTEDNNVTSAGRAFRMTPSGVLTTLAFFTGANGLSPSAGIVLGTNGYSYGTTEFGGNLSLNGGNGFGTVFRMTSAGALTTLASFSGVLNGSAPFAALVQGSEGNFYGTTAGGGAFGCGTVFKMTPAGALTTLVHFNGVNGNSPQAPLIQGTDGNFYGTTTYGGPNGGGTVFQVTTNGVLTTLVAFGPR
ncbi:MAG TPA: choice-of-anchor tandem repeat GloVer-containing protein [Candidatus Acidoferrum sp.]|nr:choice-of-anchor tandem repeat GloVer-containing protein [Candidatus Acidoferrum sp.]